MGVTIYSDPFADNTEDPKLAMQSKDVVRTDDPRADPFAKTFDMDYAVKAHGLPAQQSVLADIPGLTTAGEILSVTKTSKNHVGTESVQATVTREPVQAKVDNPPSEETNRTLSSMFVVTKMVIKCEVTRSPLMYNKVSASAEVEMSAIENDAPLTSAPKAMKWLLAECNRQADQGSRDMIIAAKKTESTR